MIHPSYVELMKVVNDDVVIGEEPVVNSRYSIVCAAARRARQLIDSSEPLIEERRAYNRKPLSIAVDELFEGKLKILTKEEASEEQEKLDQLSEKTKEVRLRVEALRSEQAELSGEKDEKKTSNAKKTAESDNTAEIIETVEETVLSVDEDFEYEQPAENGSSDIQE